MLPTDVAPNCSGSNIDGPKRFFRFSLEDSIGRQSRGHIQAFEFKDRLPIIGNTVVESLRFVTYDRQFARVVIRYKGNTTHNQILHHLQSLFGPIDRAPGSMMRGLNQQFTWRGTETEVNLTYDSDREGGTIFIESRTLAPRFNDVLPEHAF